MKTYILDKMSRPGFTLRTEHIAVVERILQDEVCDMCKTQDEDYPDYEQEGLTVETNFYETLLKNKEKLYKRISENSRMLPKENERKMEIVNGLIVECLMGTSCGAEYWLSTEDDEKEFTNEELKEAYWKQQEEDMQEYNKMIKEGICTL